MHPLPWLSPFKLVLVVQHDRMDEKIDADMLFLTGKRHFHLTICGIGGHVVGHVFHMIGQMLLAQFPQGGECGQTFFRDF